jgi:menaquinone-dependent protoporphyrinogen oxidase
MKLLLVYGTTEGHTQKLVRFVADHLVHLGHQTEVVNAIDDTAVATDPREFDAVIIAASVHSGRYQSAVIQIRLQASGRY